MGMRFCGRVVLLCGLCLSLAACGSKAGSSSGEGSYSGASSISGTVVVSASDLSKLGQSSTSSLGLHSLKSQLGDVEIREISSPTVLQEGTAYLYEVKSDGSIVYTGKTTSVVDGQYTFSGIKDGIKYLVSIRAQGEDSLGVKQALKMDAFVDLKSGVALVSGNATEKTSVVARYMVDKVVKVGGNKFDSDTAKVMATTALDAVNAGLSDGSIPRVSSVMPTSGNVLLSTDYSKPSNVDDSTLEVLENSDSVRKLAQQASLESKLQNGALSVDQAKAIIRSIFGGSEVSDSKSGGDGDGPPEFFIDQFAQK